MVRLPRIASSPVTWPNTDDATRIHDRAEEGALNGHPAQTSKAGSGRHAVPSHRDRGARSINVTSPRSCARMIAISTKSEGRRR